MQTFTQTTPSYAKLRSGNWGVRVPFEVEPGQAIVVKTKKGKTREETIGRIVWQGNGVWLCTVAPREWF